MFKIDNYIILKRPSARGSEEEVLEFSCIENLNFAIVSPSKTVCFFNWRILDPFVQVW